MLKLELPGYVCYGSKFGLATLMVSEQFFKIKKSWRFKERCTAVLFGAVFGDGRYAPDCKKDFSACETFTLSVPKILRKGRRAGAKEFCILQAT